MARTTEPPTDEAAPGDGPEVADLVVIPSPRTRSQVGCGERVGVVLEDRRTAVKVFFPEIDRAFWVDRAAVLSVAEDRLPAAPLARRLHEVGRALSAVAIEVYDREGDAEVFHVYSRGTDLDALNRVRDALGTDFRRMAIEPGGVRRARVTLVFRAPTPPPPAGGAGSPPASGGAAQAGGGDEGGRNLDVRGS